MDKEKELPEQEEKNETTIVEGENEVGGDGPGSTNPPGNPPPTKP